MGHIVAGYLLMFLDFNINGIDFIPDFVGYILIAIGASRMIVKSNSFSVAKISAIIMLIYDIIITLINMQGDVIVASTLIGMAVSIFMSYYIVKGIRDIQDADGIQLGAQTLKNIWIADSVLMILCELGVAAGDSELFGISALIGVIVRIMYIIKLNVARNTYNDACVIQDEQVAGD